MLKCLDNWFFRIVKNWAANKTLASNFEFILCVRDDFKNVYPSSIGLVTISDYEYYIFNHSDINAFAICISQRTIVLIVPKSIDDIELGLRDNTPAGINLNIIKKNLTLNVKRGLL